MSFVKGQHALGSDSLSSCFSPHTWTATHVLCVVEVVVYVLKTAVGARDTSRERFSRSARLGIQGTARPAWCPRTRQPRLAVGGTDAPARLGVGGTDASAQPALVSE